MKRIHVLPLLVLLVGCAQVREPQGGPQDRIPPRLIAAFPENGSVRVDPERIVLRFDERVKLERVRERLMISPPPTTMPIVSIGRSNEVVIALREPLKAATTYVFQIGEAVVDLTEGNMASGLTYVISTGDHIDSLAIGGRITDAFSGSPVAKALVMAYAEGDTSSLTRGRPAYFTRTDSAGRYAITHMRPGRFQLAALQDKNGNYRYDLPTEEIAFHEPPITAGQEQPVAMRMFRERAALQQVLEAKVMPDRAWRLALAKPSPGLALRQLDREGDRLSWTMEWTKDRDTLLAWPSDTALLAGQRFAVQEDTLVVDSIVYRPPATMPFHTGLQFVPGKQGAPDRLLAARPIAALRKQLLQATVDSTIVEWEGAVDPSDQRTVHFADRPSGATRLTVLPAAITDIYGGSNDTLNAMLGTSTPTATGDLYVALTSGTGDRPGPWILQLINAQGGVVRQSSTAGIPARVEWRSVEVGNYSLKLVHDRNGDERWTTGSLAETRQAELVFPKPERVDLRAGWELELKWELPPQE